MTTLVSGLAATIAVTLQRQSLSSQAAPAAKILICHLPPGQPENAQAIYISSNAWETGHTPHASHTEDYVVGTDMTCPRSLTPTITLTPTPDYSD